MVTLFITLDGTVQICPPEELRLDAHPEEDAIAALLAQGKDENDIIAYLRGRAARQPREVRDAPHL